MLVVPFEVARYPFALPLDRLVRVEPMADLVALPRPIASMADALVDGGRALAGYDLRSKFRLGDGDRLPVAAEAAAALATSTRRSCRPR